MFRSRENKKYSFEYKLSVVELYLSSEISYQELAHQESIHNPTIITKWVNDFKIAGADALKPKKKGRKKSLDTSKKAEFKAISEESPVNISAEHIKQL